MKAAPDGAGNTEREPDPLNAQGAAMKSTTHRSERLCPTCQTSMNEYASRAIYCSEGCKVCSVETCSRKVASRGLCSTHYDRLRKGKALILPCLDCGKDITGIRGNPKRCPDCTTCNADGCARDQKAGGYCVGHYERWFRTGNPCRPCATCGKDLPFGLNPKAIHCSDECDRCSVGGCTRKHQARGYCHRHYERWRVTGKVERPCQTCGIDMVGTVGAGIYCSEKCRQCPITGCENEISHKGMCSMHNKRMSAYGVVDRGCEKCGKPLSCNSGSAIYCSDECKPRCVVEWCTDMSYFRSGHCRRHRGQFVYHGGKIPSLEFQCSLCGETVIRKDSGSHRSNGKLCISCRGRNHREYSWYRKEVLAKGEADCGICGNSIDFTLKYPHSGSLTIDHILPLSLGGDSSRSNLRPAHALCNSRRGDRLDESMQVSLPF